MTPQPPGGEARQDALAEPVRAVQEGLARSESEGQRRMLALHGGSRNALEIHPKENGTGRGLPGREFTRA
ncbi:hypothetical protein [Streptomyces sp. CoH17]|uniref:hypothetical protein n=1 Tax=Streptomyces sp. CoH17 TaxID=2992806 RepID=UPI0022708F5E|nr:hypothetical protein [Streptomyces sp. CoH17]